MKRTIGAGLAALFLSLSHPAVADELSVFAAASLTDALKEIAVQHEKDAGVKLRFQFGGSNILARQIEEGAPADVFISADEAKMDGLEKKGRILKETRKSLLSNSLVIVVSSDSPVRIEKPDTLATDTVKRLALADPQAVPAGIYAREYLTKLGLWEKISPKVVPTENVRAALSAVESGNIEAAIVYKTDAAISKKVKIAFEVPPANGPRISYPFAVVADSKNAAAAKKFIAHLESDAALAVFKKYGFLIQK